MFITSVIEISIGVQIIRFKLCKILYIPKTKKKSHILVKIP